MPFSDSVAADVLVRCARHCCICRRFDPIRLQVHHIELESEGGSNDAENAFPVCLTCHNDVHTKAPFTRRFTVAELKGHRDAVYALVAQGKLPREVPGAVKDAAAAVAQAGVTTREITLTPIQVRILTAAGTGTAHNQGHVEIVLHSIEMGDTKISFQGRESAQYREAFQGLFELGVFDRTDDYRVFYLNERGYRMVDQLLAMGAQKSA